MTTPSDTDPPPDTAAAEALLADILDALDNLAAMAGQPQHVALPPAMWDVGEAAALPGWVALRDTGRIRRA